MHGKKFMWAKFFSKEISEFLLEFILSQKLTKFSNLFMAHPIYFILLFLIFAKPQSEEVKLDNKLLSRNKILFFHLSQLFGKLNFSVIESNRYLSKVFPQKMWRGKSFYFISSRIKWFACKSFDGLITSSSCEKTVAKCIQEFTDKRAFKLLKI